MVRFWPTGTWGVPALLLVGLSAIPQGAAAGGHPVCFQNQAWVGSKDTHVEVAEHRGIEAIRLRCLRPRSTAYAKDIEFRTGTIEFDMAISDRGAAGVVFGSREDGGTVHHVRFNPWPRLDEGLAPSRLRQSVTTVGRCTHTVVTFYHSLSPQSEIFERSQWFHVRLVVGPELCHLHINGDSDPTLVFQNTLAKAEPYRIGIGGANCYVANTTFSQETN